MLEYNKNVINSLEQSRETLENTKKALEEAVEQQDEELERLEEITVEVQGWIKRAEEAIAESNRQIQENIALQAELDRETSSVQNEIARLTRELQARQESQRRYVGGTFLWPLPTDRNHVSSGFGPRRSPITGRNEHHNGIDIPAPRGTQIFAANDGIVILSTSSAGYGNYIVIDHGGGKTTMYAHNTTNNVKVGDNVKRGDVIGTVGSTGWSTGNHLHLSYYEDGVPKNPLLNGFSVP
jgi:murein DD-endopeptidase MepM/ murein hydrolase activator NlpD